MKPWPIIVALGLMGCPAPATSNPPGASLPGGTQMESIVFSELEAGGFGQITTQGGQVLKEGSAWQQHVIDAKGADTTAPDVDFTKDMVVAVYAGEKPSGGYTVAVKKIEKSAAEIVVTAKVTAPAPDMGTISVLTHPYQWVKLTKSDLPVRFVFE